MDDDVIDIVAKELELITHSYINCGKAIAAQNFLDRLNILGYKIVKETEQ